MAAILNFQIFRRNCKTQKCLYLENRARQSDFDDIFHPQGISAEWPSQFSKKLCLAENGGHFEFSNFSQKLQNTKMLVSRKPCEMPSQFSKIFVSPKMEAILNFRIFRISKTVQPQKCLYLENRARLSFFFASNPLVFYFYLIKNICIKDLSSCH